MNKNKKKERKKKTDVIRKAEMKDVMKMKTDRKEEPENQKK